MQISGALDATACSDLGGDGGHAGTGSRIGAASAKGWFGNLLAADRQIPRHTRDRLVRQCEGRTMRRRPSAIRRLLRKHDWAVAAILTLAGLLLASLMVALDQKLRLRPEPDRLWLHGGAPM